MASNDMERVEGPETNGSRPEIGLIWFILMNKIFARLLDGDQLLGRHGRLRFEISQGDTLQVQLLFDYTAVDVGESSRFDRIK